MSGDHGRVPACVPEHQVLEQANCGLVSCFRWGPGKSDCAAGFECQWILPPADACPQFAWPEFGGSGGPGGGWWQPPPGLPPVPEPVVPAVAPVPAANAPPSATASPLAIPNENAAVPAPAPAAPMAPVPSAQYTPSVHDSSSSTTSSNLAINPIIAFIASICVISVMAIALFVANRTRKACKNTGLDKSSMNGSPSNNSADAIPRSITDLPPFLHPPAPAYGFRDTFFDDVVSISSSHDSALSDTAFKYDPYADRQQHQRTSFPALVKIDADSATPRGRLQSQSGLSSSVGIEDLEYAVLKHQKEARGVDGELASLEDTGYVTPKGAPILRRKSEATP
ncbi:UNVERIFIED_CONTAM: hypothetical protein HDU68_010716 [Siphonaria sp. JEL0065]|nr:hypothetical protein HDU68_010716 [Siphonaria sp. JEL0065]